MRKGNLLLCGIVAVAMLAPSCQAIAPDVEYKRLPDWNCLEGLESYTEENGAIVPVLHVGGNWKCNFANQWGELLVEGVFDDFGEFSEGLALVRVGDTFGYIDTLGTMVIQLPEDASYCGDFHNGRAFIKGRDGDRYYIDRTGEIIYRSPEDVFLAAEFDVHGIAPAKDLQSGLYGYYNQDGYWEIPPQYETTYSFEGDYAFFREDGKGGIMDRSGAIILPPKYSIVYTLSEGDPALFGICETRDEKQLYGLADSNGTILIEPQDKWTYSVPMYSCGYCVVNYRYRQYDPESGDYTDSSPNSLIDEKGNEIPLPYEVTDSQFYDGFLLVRDPERTAYLNTDLEEVLSLDISFEEYSASPLIDGIVAVTKDIGSHTYVIDQDGELICEMTDSRLHDDFGVFSEGTCWARTVSETEGGSFLYFDPRLKDYTSPWAAAEMDRAQAAGLVTESNDSSFTFRITRRRFAELMANLVEKTTGRSITPAPEGTFSDTDDLWVRKAAALGLVNGLDDGRFSPNGYINREQLAVMLHRTIEYLEDETGRSVLADAGGLESFTDAGQVSGWAADSLAALTASGILQGTSSATLSPKDTTTVEQAILLTLRAYQEFSK